VELADFDYALPPAAIAQSPAPRRDGSRLLVIDRARRTLEDRCFADLPGLLRSGDCLVVNDSRVIPARVLARDEQGGAVELLFLEPETEHRWTALVRPGRRCRPGARLRAGASVLTVRDVTAEGARVVERADGPVQALLDAVGRPPLPPYITRNGAPSPEDRERYQTVYAGPPGSVAAPTAGLHFSPDLLAELARRGIEVHALTLHVGAATFRPIRVPRVEDHRLPAERVSIPGPTARAVAAARAEGRRVVAVGTTCVRALESVARASGRVEPYEGRADIFVTPGHRFQVVDALVTNFHLPRSSLLVLVAALAGRAAILEAYRHALGAGYRVGSYGDATLIQ
jgi:S-adenosylmethionine:tRNA ribosyltransferase-isomerase